MLCIDRVDSMSKDKWLAMNDEELVVYEVLKQLKREVSWAPLWHQKVARSGGIVYMVLLVSLSHL